MFGVCSGQRFVADAVEVWQAQVVGGLPRSYGLGRPADGRGASRSHVRRAESAVVLDERISVEPPLPWPRRSAVAAAPVSEEAVRRNARGLKARFPDSR